MMSTSHTEHHSRGLMLGAAFPSPISLCRHRSSPPILCAVCKFLNNIGRKLLLDDNARGEDNGSTIQRVRRTCSPDKRPMLDPRRKRQLLLFFGNAASGVVAVVVTFIGAVLTDQAGPLAPLIALVIVPALATTIWRSDLKLRGREPDLAKRVGWQVLWVLIAWDAVGIAIAGFFIFFALSAMAPVPHSHDTAGMAFLIVTPAVVLLALWFTWVRSRRMLDLLWPLPGTAQPGSEPPHWQLKL
jgi:hypothetical protein